MGRRSRKVFEAAMMSYSIIASAAISTASATDAPRLIGTEVETRRTYPACDVIQSAIRLRLIQSYGSLEQLSSFMHEQGDHCEYHKPDRGVIEDIEGNFGCARFGDTQKCLWYPSHLLAVP